LIALASLTSETAQAATVSDCMTCSQTASGEATMCPITVEDNLYAVLCCDPSDADSRCAAADCTKSYTTLKHKWFNSCPNISVAQCGGKTQTFVADSEKGVFGLKNMIIETVNYKQP
jgi:hypothetical protein